MRKILVFGEDDAHERVLKTLLDRIAEEQRIPIEITVRSSIGGYARAISEFGALLSEIQRGLSPRPDMIVIATDANCKGIPARMQAIDERVPAAMKSRIVCAIPDPHIERWLLLDSAAFKQILGKGCKAPDHKCKRDRYKVALANAVRDAGVRPLLGGIEYAEDIIACMDFDRAMHNDKSLHDTVDALRKAFRCWKDGNPVYSS